MASEKEDPQFRRYDDDFKGDQDLNAKNFTQTALGDSDEDVELVHGVNERALLRRLDLKLLPALTLLYLLSFLDRSNGTINE